MDSHDGKVKPAPVVILVVISIEHEDVVTDCNGVELVTYVEIWAQSALHSRLATGDRKTECDRDIVDDVLERVIVLDRREKGWTMSWHVERLTVGNVDILDVERVEEGTNVLGGVVRNGTGESVRQDPDPDSRVGVVTVSVLDGLDAWDIVVTEVLLFLGIVLVLVLVVLDLLVSVFVEPGESNEINRRDFDLLLVE